MSKEQNIDDIVKLLRDSVTSETQDVDTDGTSESDEISSELLQETLKNKFITADTVDTLEATETEYVIDSDFLTVSVESKISADEIINTIAEFE